MLDVLHRAWTSEGEFRFVLRFVIGWIKYVTEWKTISYLSNSVHVMVRCLPDHGF